MDVLYLDSSKVFDTVSHSILLEKVSVHGFNRYLSCWVKNWLDGWAQRVLVNGMKFSCQAFTSGTGVSSV